jgi:hypothetical protein
MSNKVPYICVQLQLPLESHQLYHQVLLMHLLLARKHEKACLHLLSVVSTALLAQLDEGSGVGVGVAVAILWHYCGNTFENRMCNGCKPVPKVPIFLNFKNVKIIRCAALMIRSCGF